MELSPGIINPFVCCTPVELIHFKMTKLTLILVKNTFSPPLSNYFFVFMYHLFFGEYYRLYYSKLLKLSLPLPMHILYLYQAIICTF